MHKEAGLDSHRSLLDALVSYFTKTTDPPKKVLKFLNALDIDDLREIPAIPQHGDFVLNNLGKTDGRLVIFDWEDYGELKLTGFDIFMLSMSIAGMSAPSAIAIAQTANPQSTPWAFAEPACETSGLPYGTFRKMIPLYLIAFRYLKRNYGLEIRERMNDLLDNVLP